MEKIFLQYTCKNSYRARRKINATYLQKRLGTSRPGLEPGPHDSRKIMKKEIIITEQDAGKRIESVCAEHFPQISRTKWSQNGTFVCDEKEKLGKTKVREGETWEVECPLTENASSDIKPWNHPLKILAESDSWVAIEKPAGIAVHPSVSDLSGETIVNALVHHFGKKLSEHFDEIDGMKVPRPGLVHRLDKVTSGVLLVAKTNAAHRYFQEHWKDVEKVYYAVVQGIPPLKGRVEGGIERDSVDRQKMTVGSSDKAKEALTRFERISSDDKTSLLKVIIPTGRTHQIRVHLSEIGFSILGDEKYGGQKAQRVFLHAAELHFPDPDNKGKIVTISSPVPSEFER